MAVERLSLAQCMLTQGFLIPFMEAEWSFGESKRIGIVCAADEGDIKAINSQSTFSVLL